MGVHAHAVPFSPHMVALFDPACWGMGYAQEACVQAWQWMRHHTPIPRVHALLPPGNQAAMALCEALHMTLRGVVHQDQDPRAHYCIEWETSQA